MTGRSFRTWNATLWPPPKPPTPCIMPKNLIRRVSIKEIGRLITATATTLSEGELEVGQPKLQEPSDLESNLSSALQDLRLVNTQAREEGYPEPSAVAISNAESLVRTMFEILPLRYDVYPSDDGEIVIDGGGSGRRIFVYCYSDGDVLYIGWVDGERCRKRTSGSDYIATDFLKKALVQLSEHLPA